MARPAPRTPATTTTTEVPWQRWTPEGTDCAALTDALEAFPAAVPAIERLTARGGRGGRGGQEGAAARRRLESVLPLSNLPGVSVELLVACLDRTALALLEGCVVTGGVRRADLTGREEVDLDAVDRAARRLQIAGLAQLDEDRLAAVDEVTDTLETPLPLLRAHASQINSDDLARACRMHGVTPASQRKADRIDALLAAVHDREHMARVLAELQDAERSALEAMVFACTRPGRGATPEIPGSVVLGDVFADDAALLYGRQHFRRTPADNPLDVLAAMLLIGELPWHYTAWVWMEVALAVTGVDHDPYELTHVPELHPISDVPGAPLDAIASLLGLLETMAEEPLGGKKTGDRRPPVATVRAAARHAGVDERAALTLTELAIALGLLAPHLGAVRGRGRNATHPVEWEVHAERVARFTALTPAEQWTRLVTAWLSAPASTGIEYQRHLARHLVLAALASLPDGRGVRASELHAWVADRHNFLRGYDDVDDVVAQLVQLGVCSSGVVGLTPAARAGIDREWSPEALTDVVASVQRGFVLQPDHTIVAPGALAPQVRAELAQIATVVSDGGATVWQLDTRRLTEVGARRGPDEVLAFLTEHASGVVPDNVARLVRDTVGGSSRLEVLDVTTVVRCDDPATLADAARHRTARLEVIAPTVATSPLERSKLVQVLRRKGVAITSSGEITGAPAARGDGSPTGGSPWGGGRSPSAPTPGSGPEGPAPRRDLAPTWMVDHPGDGGEVVPPRPIVLGPARYEQLAARLAPT